MTDVVQFPIIARPAPIGKPTPRLGTKEEPCAVANVAHLQDAQLNTLTTMVTVVLEALALSYDNDQAIAQMHAAVRRGVMAYAQDCRDKT